MCRLTGQRQFYICFPNRRPNTKEDNTQTPLRSETGREGECVRECVLAWLNSGRWGGWVVGDLLFGTGNPNNLSLGGRRIYKQANTSDQANLSLSRESSRSCCACFPYWHTDTNTIGLTHIALWSSVLDVHFTASARVRPWPPFVVTPSSRPRRV